MIQENRSHNDSNNNLSSLANPQNDSISLSGAVGTGKSNFNKFTMSYLFY
jgi:hypothetical protein